MFQSNNTPSMNTVANNQTAYATQNTGSTNQA